MFTAVPSAPVTEPGTQQVPNTPEASEEKNMGRLGNFRFELNSWNSRGGGPEGILIPAENPTTLKVRILSIK